EDGIRDRTVTGVQTCALPILDLRPWPARTAGAYVKFGVHERPTLGVAVALMRGGGDEAVTDARLAIGCVGPRPQRSLAAEARVRSEERRVGEGWRGAGAGGRW